MSYREFAVYLFACVGMAFVFCVLLALVFLAIVRLMECAEDR